MAETIMDFPNIRRPAFSDSDTDRYKQHTQQKSDLQSQPGYIKKKKTTMTEAKPPQAPQALSRESPPEDSKLRERQAQEEGDASRKLKRRKSKKKKNKRKEKDTDDQREQRRDRENRRHYFSDSTSDEDTGNQDTSPVLRKRNSRLDRAHPTEVKQLNIIDERQPVISEAASRISGIEQRLTTLEENTTRSLYNIEALLRNAVFYRGGPSAQTPSPVISSVTNPFMAPGARAAPPRSSDLPYRRNLNFPPFN